MEPNSARLPDPRDYLDDRPGEGLFRVRHDAFTDPAVFDLEMARIFESTWIYVGLESEIARPHDFITTQIGRVPVILMRDEEGTIRAVLNSCRHRGTLLCPLHKGHQRVHVCRYHGWTYDSAGRNVGITGRHAGQYPDDFDTAGHGLIPVPKVASYRGFIFASLAAAVPSLETHLGDARMFLDLVADQAPEGFEFVPGTVTYTYDANWKFQFENGLDVYHFASTHASFVQILRQRPPEPMPADMATDLQDPDPPGAGSFSFAHGHAVTWSVGIPALGPERRPLPRDPARLEGIRKKYGDTRVKWMLRQRNLTIFPNVQIIDIQSLQVRVWQPLAVDKTRMVSNCLAPIGERPEARTFRIRQYEEFFNPGGLATADDNVMYALCQSGYTGAAGRSDSQGYARGIAPSPDRRYYGNELGLDDPRWAYGPQDAGDETCFHAGYREWLRLMTRGE